MTTFLDRPRTRTVDPSTHTASVSSHSGAAAVPDQHAPRRAIIAAGLGSLALIHVLNLSATIHELPYLGWMFIGLILSSLVIAEGLLRADSVKLWLAAGALSASVIAGYALSRTAGLPGDGGGDKGNWFEPLGLATLVVAGIVILLSVGRLTTRRT